MTRVSISPARTLDAGAVGHILSASNAALCWLPRVYTAAEEIRHAGEMIDAGWVRVARTDGNPVGFIARCAHRIHALYVQPDAQREGVGTVLMNDAKAKRDRLTLWSYEANRDAAQFYSVQGFRAIDRTDGSGNEARLPDVCFEWIRGTI